MLLLLQGYGVAVVEDIDPIVESWTLYSRSVAFTLERRSVGWSVRRRSVGWTIEEDDR